MSLDLQVIDSSKPAAGEQIWQFRSRSADNRGRFTLRYSNVKLLAPLCDTVTILGVGILVGASYQRFVLGSTDDGFRFTALALVVAVVFVVASSLRGLYEPQQLMSWASQARNAAWLWAGTFLFFTATAFALKSSEDFSRGTTMLFAVAGFVVLLFVRGFWAHFIRSAMRASSLTLRKVVLVTRNRDLVNPALIEELERNGLSVERTFALPTWTGGAAIKFREVGAQIVSHFRKSGCEEIVILSSLNRPDEIAALVNELRLVAAPIFLLPDPALSEIIARPVRQIGPHTSFELHRPPLTTGEQALKRCIDIAVGSIALILSVPVLLLVAIAVKLDSSGPILFRQTRRGFNGKEFDIFKFRTMSVMENGDDVKQVHPNDSRLTRVGCWLRKTSIDELPQLLNVLRGEMSLIGPRPHAVAHDNFYEKMIANYAFRQHVKPGITGWAQVNNLRGATPTIASMRRRVE
ncbi:MAG: exopolysaccharide biosynthesis polyprenyl glycosylphosphotransferase, partial [Rhizobiales bacterium]|nr:exopolysaccharide biosynthesis polyprenyl glycosylphosphotransferase [Hyphomicrobiales bacterium]